MKTMKVTIRKAGTVDIEDILDITDTYSTPWTALQWSGEFRNSFSDILALEADGFLMGYAVIWKVAGDIQLNKIAIRDDARRSGLGTILLKHILEWGAREKRGSIYLEVHEGNSAALSFYKKNGFIETGRRKNYYSGGDAILMERKVANEN